MKPVVLISLLATLLYSDVGTPCSCLPEPSTQEALAAADAVFTARVVALKIVAGTNLGERTTEDVIAEMEVYRGWKGGIRSRVEIRTSLTCCLCGFGFGIGQEYLIYATTHRDTLRVSVCSRSKELFHAAADIERLSELVGQPKSLNPPNHGNAADGTQRFAPGSAADPRVRWAAVNHAS